MERSVRLIINPRAGGGRAARLLPAVESALRSHGVTFTVAQTTSIEHARALARAARAAGELAAAMGGDGLVGAVASELEGGGTLGVLPGGRGNDFARKLGLGDDPVAACAVLTGGRERLIDLAAVGDRRYLGILSAGLDSDVQAIVNATRLPLGGAVYVYGALRALATWKSAGWEVEVDGERHAFRGYSVAVAKSGVFGGGMWLVPQAQPDDGLLHVVLIRDRPRLRYLAALPRVFRATHLSRPGITVLTGREITFSCDRPFAAYADGDPIADLPVTVGIRPRALRVIAP
jgi:YegS/Rv2252/BmrU family lipid kinase